MSKGDLTRQAILDHAVALSSVVGLGGLTIGRLATELDLSKSGLFAHFRSKETLQIQVLETAAAHFTATVIRPALAAPRGAARVRALFERWLAWAESDKHPGGCVFVSAASELDDQPGPVRDRLVALQRDWLAVLARAAQLSIDTGEFRPDTDPDQFAFELYGTMLAWHHATRLLDDPMAADRARRAFDSLLTRTSAATIKT